MIWVGWVLKLRYANTTAHISLKLYITEWDLVVVIYNTTIQSAGLRAGIRWGATIWDATVYHLSGGNNGVTEILTLTASRNFR